MALPNYKPFHISSCGLGLKEGTGEEEGNRRVVVGAAVSHKPHVENNCHGYPKNPIGCASFKTISNTLWALNMADNKFDAKAALINIIKDIC